ncbi:glycosyltransferase family 4 protein [uncultured Thiocystis sp.]|jgi:colanic acid biosynthesis glycosyl transferase WcaI|uniref:glycosyltransferase family 4 protein n=1 Tax=uncultured Thiocystis sp. TaxID=1202134 RepID=UPI0025D88C09|nr:glycosyltransferase family 4 protein [uncultured Thiocystis sp.]
MAFDAHQAHTPPKTVTIASLFYWPEKTGIAPPVQQLAEMLAQSGAQVTVLTPRPSYPEMAVFPAYRGGARDRETHQGVSIIRVPIAPQKPGGGLISRFITEGGFAWRIWWRLARHPRPELMIAVCPSILTVGAMLLAVSSKSQRVAVVYDIQSGLAKSLQMTGHSAIATLIEWLERITLNPVDRIITLSQAMTDAIRGIGVATPISIIPPTVDDDLIQPRLENPGPITLLYSGNIGRKQGLEQLIDLAERIQQRQLDVALIIRGDGNYREELQRRARARGVDNLRFEPLLPVERLSEGLAEGHIHLVPQNPAGAAFAVPSKIYSIMAAGRPFICTADLGSPLDRLRAESDAFLICPPNQSERFADTVEHLMADPAERARLGRNGRAYVEQHAGKAACERAYRALLLDTHS